MSLGTRIQALRREQGLSQEQLADELGVSRQAIGKWESGASVPSIDNLLELAQRMGTTVDYLLRGSAPQEPPEAAEKLEAHTEENVSLAAVAELLSTETAVRRRQRRIGYGIFGAAFLLLLGLCLYCLVQVSGLWREVETLQTSAEEEIQTSVGDQLSRETSLLSSWDVGEGAYDPETKTASLRLTAALKTFTEDTQLYFVLSPMGSSENTLSESITAEGVQTAERAGDFAAELQVPLVQDFTISAVLEQDGFRQTEKFLDYYGFSSLYIPTMEAEIGSFTWTVSGSTLTVSGYPTVRITPASAVSGPVPEMLLSELYIDGELAETYETELLSTFQGTDGTAKDAVFVFYPRRDEGSEKYPTDGEPEVRWRFTMTDSEGQTYSAEISG